MLPGVAEGLGAWRTQWKKDGCKNIYLSGNVYPSSSPLAWQAESQLVSWLLVAPPIQNADHCYIKVRKKITVQFTVKIQLTSSFSEGVAVINQMTDVQWIRGRSVALRLTALPAFVLTSLVWFLLLLSDCWRKSLDIKRTVTEGLWSFPRETAERSGETVGSLLLEIVIMLRLWYWGYWEHTFKPPILRAVIKRELSHSSE